MNVFENWLLRYLNSQWILRKCFDWEALQFSYFNIWTACYGTQYGSEFVWGDMLPQADFVPFDLQRVTMGPDGQSGCIQWRGIQSRLENEKQLSCTAVSVMTIREEINGHAHHITDCNRSALSFAKK